MMSLKISEREGHKWFVWQCPHCPARMASLNIDMVSELRRKHLTWHMELRDSENKDAIEEEDKDWAKPASTIKSYGSFPQSEEEKGE